MLAYTTRGDGDRVVLFVHGVLSTGRSLAPLARRLLTQRPELRAILPDLPGHNDAPTEDTPPTIDAVADRLVELVAHLADEPIDVVGHSMGGRIALRAAQRAPEHIRSVVVLDAPAGPLQHRPSPLEPTIDALLAAPEQAPDADAMREALEHVDPNTRRWLLGHLATEADHVRWTVDRAYVAALRQSVMHADLFDAPSVFVLRGERSPFVIDEDIEACREHGIEVIDIPNAGHDLHVSAARVVVGHLCTRLDRRER